MMIAATSDKLQNCYMTATAQRTVPHQTWQVDAYSIGYSEPLEAEGSKPHTTKQGVEFHKAPDAESRGRSLCCLPTGLVTTPPSHPHTFVPMPNSHNECWHAILPHVDGTRDPGDALRVTEVRLAVLYAKTSQVSTTARTISNISSRTALQNHGLHDVVVFEMC